MRPVIMLCLLSSFVAGTGRVVLAQRATVQQPVVSNFGVSTTVSVPDRGRAHLGSYSRAGESRKAFGPFVRGSSRGSFRDHTSTSVGATIHDFEEMDRRLLGRTSRYPVGPRLSRGAENAYQSLLARHSSASSARDVGQPRSSARSERRLTASLMKRPGASVTSRSVSRRSTGGSGHAEKFLADGLRAENRGAHSLARNYYRIAARLGSKTAKRRMELIGKKLSASALRR